MLERVRLVAIAAERIDVFFMTRVGRLKRLNAEGVSNDALKRLFPAMSDWVREKTGRDLLREVLASIPGLTP
mgnify:CR=1 FL=1